MIKNRLKILQNNDFSLLRLKTFRWIACLLYALDNKLNKLKSTFFPDE